MRVPADPHNPTYNHVFLVGFWRWLTSSAADRREWRRRRDIALKIQHRQGVDAIHAWADRSRQRRVEARPTLRPARHAPRQPRAGTGGRLSRFEQFLLGLELVSVLLPLAAGILVIGAIFVFWVMR